jgi:hypothetical protein
MLSVGLDRGHGYLRESHYDHDTSVLNAYAAALESSSRGGAERTCSAPACPSCRSSESAVDELIRAHIASNALRPRIDAAAAEMPAVDRDSDVEAAGPLGSLPWSDSR